jgi:hypothetical protein|tara:strand:- start:110 stop:1264 length:1155 start_codon:yes stop_codon:yes gene_type:complete
MKKNLYIKVITFLIGSLAIIYSVFFTHTFFNLENSFGWTFKSSENLNFHEKYSKKIHHIREESVLDWLWKKPKVEDLLFTTINEINDKKIIVLFQGDSYMEQLTFPGPDKNHISAKLVQKFGNEKKIGFINAGTGSYSPSVMNAQLDVLEADFKILPNIVVAYIDQSDLGDENCRYKNNKVYENGILKSIEPENYLMWRETFNYSEVYELSKIKLNNISKISKTFQLVNFKIKYGVAKSSIRFYRKYISQSSIDKAKLIKCYWSETERYLIKPKDAEIKYFKDQVKDYLLKMEKKKHIEKVFLVTFPHKKHFNKTYKYNVSDIIDDVMEDKKNVTHINLSRILLNDVNFNYKNIWLEDNVHLNPENHGNLFIKIILEELSKYLM